MRDPDSFQWCFSVMPEQDGLESHAAMEPYDCDPQQPRTVRTLCGERILGWPEQEQNTDGGRDQRCSSCLVTIGNL